MNRIDRLGLWQFEGSGRDPSNSRAALISEPGDTPRSLAKIIGLEPDEYRKWMKSDRGSGKVILPHPRSADSRVNSGCRWTVPNTAIYFTGSTWSGFPPFGFGLDVHNEFALASARARMRELGIKLVVEFGTSGSDPGHAKGALGSSLRKHGKDLLGFFWFGHAAQNGLPVVGRGAGETNKDVLTTADFHPNLNHKLWFAYFNTCYTGVGCGQLDPTKNYPPGMGSQYWNSLVSQYGIAYASDTVRYGNQTGDSDQPGHSPPGDFDPSDNHGPFKPDGPVR